MITTHEIDELAIHICGVDENDEEAVNNLEEAIFEKFDIEYEAFGAVVQELFNLIVIGQSPLSGKWYKGFGSNGVMLVREEISD